MPTAPESQLLSQKLIRRIADPTQLWKSTAVKNREMDQSIQTVFLISKPIICGFFVVVLFFYDVPNSSRSLVFINKWHCIEMSAIHIEFHIRLRFNKWPLDLCFESIENYLDWYICICLKEHTKNWFAIQKIFSIMDVGSYCFWLDFIHTMWWKVQKLLF